MKFQKKSPVTITVLLSLTLLMSLPGSIGRVNAISQSGLTRWSPFGPQMQNLIATEYSSTDAMLNAFDLGLMDITDAPIRPSTVSSDTQNPDFFVTTPTLEYGLDELDINHHSSFMGFALQSSRATVPAAVSVGTSSTACSSGFGSLTITLRNQETGNSLIQDQYNTLTIANQPSGSPSSTVSDQGGATPTGVYQVPCILAGTYKLSSSAYSGTVSVTITSNQNTNYTFFSSWNSPSTETPTAASSLIGAALSHTLDKPSLVSDALQGLGVDLDFPAPLNWGLSVATQAQKDADCNFLKTIDGAIGCLGDVSAYHLATSALSGSGLFWATLPGKGYSGQLDLQAACDYFLATGFSMTPSGSVCADLAKALMSSVAPSSYPHLVPSGNVIMYLSSDDFLRKTFGQIVADTINALFGMPSTSGGGIVCYGPCPQFLPRFFSDSTTESIVRTVAGGLAWNLFTGRKSLSTEPIDLWSYHSQSAGPFCIGGPNSPFYIKNVDIFCDAQTDTLLSEMKFSTGGAVTVSIANLVNIRLGMSAVASVPIFERDGQMKALTAFSFQVCGGSACTNTQSSLVNTLGRAFGGGRDDWALLNMRPVPGYTPSNSIYTAGGGNPTVIRKGLSEDTTQLSPFMALSDSDWEIVTLILDSMLALNPLTGGSNSQLLDWQTTSHSSSFNPAEVSCNPMNGCVTGTTTQTWHLRNDLYFQDGKPVTALDIAYSIMAYQDVPSAVLQPEVSDVSAAVGLDCNQGQSCKTLQVKLQNSSPFYEINIGTLPIIEKALWTPFCGDPPSPNSQCADPTFDPMAAGIMIGDGPWACIGLPGSPHPGRAGGSCSQNADGSLGGQAITTGGKFLFTRNAPGTGDVTPFIAGFQHNRGYVRCCPDDTVGSSSLYQISWADANNDGVVNILDLASAAVHFGSPDAYWVNNKIAPGTTVNIQDLATVAFYFGHGITTPFTPAQLESTTTPGGMDPQFDPFFCPQTGC